MTDPNGNPEEARQPSVAGSGDGGPGDGGSTVGAPRWVKVFGLVALALAVLVVVLVLAGGGPGGHGPGRHRMSAGVAGQPPLFDMAGRSATPA